MKKLKFYIAGIDYNKNSGGAVVLHKLNHLLTERGEDSTIVCQGNLNADWTGKLIDKAWTELNLVEEGSIGIYPEIASTSNPMNTKYVVRWVLQTPGDPHGNYNKGDVVFKYNNLISVSENIEVAGLLSMPLLYGVDYWKCENKERSGVAYLIKKGDWFGERVLNAHPEDAICIDTLASNGEMDTIRDIFNRVETFISYDDLTLFSAFAALAGCLSVVVPGKKTEKEWKSADPYKGYGIAYGFNDGNWAKQTRPLLIEEMSKQNSITDKQLDAFITTCYQRFQD